MPILKRGASQRLQIMLNRRTLLASAVLLAVAALAGLMYWSRSASLERRIEATASKLIWPEGNQGWPPRAIPKTFEQEAIALAKEPTSDLERAFRSLDA